MAAKTGFFMDFSDFDKGFEKIMKKYPQFCADGMYLKAGPPLIAAAIKEEPRAPHLWGELWKSQRITRPEIVKGEIFFFLGFNIKYAGYQHEKMDVKDYTMTGSGPKFLEVKLQKYASAVLKRVAMYVDKMVRSMK